MVLVQQDKAMPAEVVNNIVEVQVAGVRVMRVAQVQEIVMLFRQLAPVAAVGFHRQ